MHTGSARSEAFESKAQLPAKLVHHFNTTCEHPAASDLIFCPEDDSAEGIPRTSRNGELQGLLGFKVE
ncbi:bacteriocin immunity protein [Pseudomonas fluorescens]|uniref:bacteriocin immunity protein n=1 Tax=Pseudomonas fluorescens TaxID=294 RepID=UPI002181EB03|nr:bacteriocin immunity protein [Pseudomonas fluorescens]